MYWSRQLKILIQRNNSKTTKFCGSELFLVGCCVVSANGGPLRLMPYPSIYFFVAIFAAQNDRKNVLTTHSASITSHHQHPSPHLSLSCLVVVTIDKTAATQDLCSTLPQFFDVYHWGAPNKGSRHSKPEPGRRAQTAEAMAW